MQPLASEVIEKINTEAKIIALEESSPGQFPVKCFPEKIQHFINETNQKLNYPIDYTAAGILTAVSVAIGGSYGVKVKNGWIEFPNIFIALVGPPGVNKSQPLTETMKPLQKRDAIAYSKYKEDLKEYDLKKRQQAKEKGEVTAIIEPPARKQTLLNDATLEALIYTHENNPRSVGVINDELAGFLKNMNRYNSGSDTEQYLSMFSGKPISVNRKGGASIYIQHPCVSIAGTIQPSILKEMGKDNKNSNGFTDRFLFAFPKQQCSPYFNLNEISPTLFSDYDNIINRLLLLDFKEYEGQRMANVLQYSNEAMNEFIAWNRSNTDLINETERETQKGIYSKLNIYVSRLALIMQMLFWACEEADREAIEEKSIKAAIKLIEYFRTTANRAASLISPYSPFATLSTLQISVLSSLPNRFTTGEGIKIIESIKVNDEVMGERRFFEFLKRTDLFKKLDHGTYEKI